MNGPVSVGVVGSRPLPVLRDPCLGDVCGHHYILKTALESLLLFSYPAHPITHQVPPGTQLSLHSKEGVDLGLTCSAQGSSVGIGRVDELGYGIAPEDLGGVLCGRGSGGKLGRGREPVGTRGRRIELLARRRRRGSRRRGRDRSRSRSRRVGDRSGEERRVEAEEVGEGSDEVEEVGGREDPGAEVGGVGDEPRAVDEGVVGLDEHVSGGGGKKRGGERG